MVGIVVTTKRMRGVSDTILSTVRTPNRSNRGLTFAEFELVKNGGLTGGVKTDHEDAHFFLSELFIYHRVV